MVNYKKMPTLLSIILFLLLITNQMFAQAGSKYEGPTDPAADRSALRVGKMDGNQMLMSFRNNTQIGFKYEVDGSKWPRDSERGLQIFDFVAIAIGAQVFLENDTIPVTDESRILSGDNLDTLYYVQTMFNYEDMLDRDANGDIVWGFHAVPGYFNELSESPAISNDPNSWPTGGWPSRGFETKWPGEWNGRFGRGVFYAELESYFVSNDAQDLEYVLPNRRVKYFPRPEVKIGDLNPNVTIQKGNPWGGLGLRVEVRGYQWNNPQSRDVVFWEYNVSNISDYDIPRTSFGYFMDMGNGNAFNFSDDADDLGGFVEEADMAYSWDSNNSGAGGYQPGTLGIAYLESPGIIGDNIDNDDDGITDEKRDNEASIIIGPTDGYTDLQKFMEFYGYKEIDQLRDHWDADEDQDWMDGIDLNGNGRYAELKNGKWVLEPGETAGNDVGLDGVGPGDLNYFGPDEDGTECNHKPDLLVGVNSEPNFGLNDISESDMLGLTAFHFIPWPFTNPPAPKFDKELYQLIGVPGLVPFTGEPADYAPVFGSGPFRLEKNTTERISCAVMGAYEDIPSLNAGNAPFILLDKKKVVQLIYESDYRFARPPEMPTLTARAYDGKVVLSWDNKADKLTREALLGGENDFEGYKLYRSTNRSFEDAERVTDAFGNPAGKVPIFQCDLKNEYYGYAQFGIVQGKAFFLGNNTGITHYYVDEDVQNGRTYYYYLAAYDRGLDTPGANLSPAENVASIIVDENENIISTSPNVQIVTPRQFASGYISPNIDVTVPNGQTKGTGIASFNVVGEPEPSAEKYKLSFIVDTVQVLGGNNPLFPGMGYLYRNIGFTLQDIADSSEIIIQETPENFSSDNILTNTVQGYSYLNPNIKSDIFGGLTFEINDNPSEGAEFDSNKTDWITGSSPIQLTVQTNAYRLFPWQTDIVFTGSDITHTTKATDISKIRRVDGIDSFDKSRLLPNETFNMIVENKQFEDSLGGSYKLDIIAYDANESGAFELDEDDVIAGYTNTQDGETIWQVTILTFNFRDSTGVVELPQVGDTYRVDAKRPFTEEDVFIIDVVRASEEMARDAEDLSKIKVVPNPYIVTNTMEPAVRNIFLNQRRRLMFTHIPSQCEIKIFTISGYLVDEIEVDNEPSNGIVHWDLLTKENLEIAPGVYLYYVKSKTTGKEKLGKFAVIK
jgi:hypothetical protein